MLTKDIKLKETIIIQIEIFSLYILCFIGVVDVRFFNAKLTLYFHPLIT
jgi:hypothetical protein